MDVTFVCSESEEEPAMDVTFVCSESEEEPFTMEVDSSDTVDDIKQKLQSRRGWPAASLSLVHNGNELADADGSATEQYGIVDGSVVHVALVDSQQPKVRRNEGAPLRVTVVSLSCAEQGRLEMEVGSRLAVSVLRTELERAREEDGFPLPPLGEYFFIHEQRMMNEEMSFEWHGVESGGKVMVFKGSARR